MTQPAETAPGNLPLVAVVTPVYNGGAHVAKTLACVQNQTYANVVHVVLDNASTDETPAAIARYAGGPVPILTRRNERLLPQIDNWNAAMAMVPAEAKYVKLLMADDLMRRDCIEQMVSVAETDDEIDFVHAIDVFNDRTKPHGLDPSISVYEGREYGRRWMIGEVTWLSGSHMFFRAHPDILHETFSKEIFPLMDMEFIFRRLLDRKMAFVFEPLIFTRFDERSVTARLGGWTSYLVPGFRIFLKYGRKFVNDEEFARIDLDYRLKIARHHLFAKATGRPIADEIKTGVAKEGRRIPLTDYMLAVVGWPMHKLRSTLVRRRAERSDPTEFVPERAFIGDRVTVEP
ncbi:glycosyltransferase family 2 protein [Lysobacter korlensis]|uniref:Glycosyltransferase family 2 protein n=1 Tax=Lysobacter korlensis TaxID=553636 RepID=A0ABV6RM70_9GAMM